jgi:plasmid stability protein
MASIIIRNIPDETHRALKLRAALNGRGVEAEICTILESVVNPVKQI